jgi:Methylamine utilisation protein MauE
MSACAHPLSAGGAIALSWLMLAAGASKLRHAAEHARAFDAYELLPAGAGRRCVPLLGAIECACGIALWLPPLHSGAAMTMLVLLLAYSGAMALNMLRGRGGIDCGCGGVLRHVPISGCLLARNAVLVLAALPVLAAPAAMPCGPRDWLAALAIAGVAALAYNGANFLLARDTLLQDD